MSQVEQIENIFQQEIARTNKRQLQSFAWRERTGARTAPHNMGTRHLFYTLRMIWNHSMPEAAQLHPFKRYVFPSHIYTEDYMKAAVVAIGIELMQRDDLDEKWIDDLWSMKNWFEIQRIEKRKEDDTGAAILTNAVD